jgi:porphobilinogen deaminase
LYAVVCSLDGKQSIQAKSHISASLENATQLGQQVADDLLSQGAAGLMANERTARSLATGG